MGYMTERGKLERMSLNTDKSRAAKDALISLCLLSGCSVVGLMFYLNGLSEANIISVYILGIILISSVVSNWMFGVISSVAGVVLFNCLYAEPRFTLLFYDSQYAITTVIILVASFFTNYIMTRFRSYIDLEKLATHRSEILLETSRALWQTQDDDGIFDVTAARLNLIFNQPSFIIPVKDGKLMEPLIKVAGGGVEGEPGENGICVPDKESVERLTSPGISEDAPTVTSAGDKKNVYFRIGTNINVYAVAGVILDEGQQFSGFERNLLYAMLGEVALSLERNRLREFNERITREAEIESLRANLLRTISHDLRTPLTSISGNADMLLNNEQLIEPSMRRQLCRSIQDDAQWLTSLVENLLFTTRMEKSRALIKMEPELLQEVIGEVVRRSQKRAKAHCLLADIQDEMLMAHMDAQLIIQVMVNIVDNAVKFAPKGSKITIRAFREGENAVVEVADTGQGISAEDKPKVFDMFYTANNAIGDSRRGIGLGLSLCRAIVRAHGGRVYIKDNEPTGAIVGFTLRLESVCLENYSTGN